MFESGRQKELSGFLNIVPLVFFVYERPVGMGAATPDNRAITVEPA
jgi:hypothetical protein